MDEIQLPSVLTKALLSPCLIGMASWIARQWGPNAGGWFAGLPLTSGPIILILALERGPDFAGEACIGTMQAISSLCAFGLAYSWSAKRLAWGYSSVISCSVYAILLWPMQFMPGRLGSAFLLVCAVLTVSLMCLPSEHTVERTVEAGKPSSWDIPIRMILGALLTVILTVSAKILGPRLAGLLTPFPIAATILAASTHRASGPFAAVRLLRSLIRGLLSFAIFFLVAGWLLKGGNVPLAFGAATLAAFVSHAILWRST